MILPLQRLHISNFKAFKSAQIPVRPITLVYGQNSAGKSSIIDALVWAAHMGQEDLPKGDFEDWDFDFELFNNRLRLGRFDNFVHRKNPKTEIGLRFSFGEHEFLGAYAGQGLYLPESEQSDIHVDLGFTKSDGLSRFSISTGPALTPLVAFDTNSNKIGFPQWNLENPDLKSYLAKVLAQFIRTLSSEIRNDSRYGLNDWQAAGGWQTNQIAVRIVKTVLTDSAFWCSMRKIPPSHLGYVGSSIDVNFGDDDFDMGTSKLLEEAPGDALGELIVKDGIEFGLAALQAKLSALLGPFEGLLHNTVYLGPLRETFDTQKLLLKRPPSSNNSWFRGSQDFDRDTRGWDLSQDAIRFVNRWLQRRATPDTNYHLRMVNIKGQKGKLASARRLQLIDKNRGIEVGFNEVGSGIGQFLPVLLAAAGQREGLICVKQPELHLHPSLQSDIADIFTGFALGEGNRGKKAFVIETHSEHLLLRIMKRMRETMEKRLPKGQAAVRPSDVSVIYVENIGKESIVREMPLNEKGELVRDWPGGFFEEGLREVLY